MTQRTLRIERTGPGVFVEDLGRAGWAHLGVPRSGAADLGALRLANRIVGNLEWAAGLEVLLGGLEFLATDYLVVAVCGAACPVKLDGRPMPRDAVLDLPPGSRLSLGAAETGLRAYLAIRGGIDVPPVLGSRSWDTLARLGPKPVRPGDTLPVGWANGPFVDGWPRLSAVPVAAPPGSQDVLALRAAPGPRMDWFDDASLDCLWGRDTGWTVTPDADRVGIRLAGPGLSRNGCHREAELSSEGMVRGAVQVPPSGQPVLFMADHPVTGGYPVVAVVLDTDVDLAAQLRPGQQVRFVRSDPSAHRSRPDLSHSWWGW